MAGGMKILRVQWQSGLVQGIGADIFGEMRVRCKAIADT